MCAFSVSEQRPLLHLSQARDTVVRFVSPEEVSMIGLLKTFLQDSSGNQLGPGDGWTFILSVENG